MLGLLGSCRGHGVWVMSCLVTMLSHDGIGLERERWDPSLSLIMLFPRCVFRL